jgi:pimeloyl-ACP methyl ester carboxylesterase
MVPIQLQVPGGTLHGDRRESRYADAPVLVALHAGVADSRSWSAMFDLLEGMPTLVAYDRRGYGASPLPDAGYDSLRRSRQRSGPGRVSARVAAG